MRICCSLLVALSFALEVITRVFEVLMDVASVTFVADLEYHFNSGITKRSKPDRPLVIDLDDVCPRGRDFVQHRCKRTWTIQHQKFEHDISSLPDQHLLYHAV